MPPGCTVPWARDIRRSATTVCIAAVISAVSQKAWSTIAGTRNISTTSPAGVAGVADSGVLVDASGMGSIRRVISAARRLGRLRRGRGGGAAKYDDRRKVRLIDN